MEEYIIKHNQEIWIKIYRILNVIMLGGLPKFANLKECETLLLLTWGTGEGLNLLDKKIPPPNATSYHISAQVSLCVCGAGMENVCM